MRALWQALEDRVLGSLLMLASLAIFTYYSLWVLVVVRSRCQEERIQFRL